MNNSEEWIDRRGKGRYSRQRENPAGAPGLSATGRSGGYGPGSGSDILSEAPSSVSPPCVSSLVLLAQSSSDRPANTTGLDFLAALKAGGPRPESGRGDREESSLPGSYPHMTFLGACPQVRPRHHFLCLEGRYCYWVRAPPPMT